MNTLPKHYDHKEAEARWQQHWFAGDVYHFRDDRPREETFVIDTPPPTVSGLLHMGHVFSYTQCDFIARYQRMTGKDVFYPMGFDDNGLPTERLVEKVKKIQAHRYIAEHGREAFRTLCDEVAEEARRDFRALFRSIALSVDWSQEYHTISPEVRKLSQESFLDLYAKGHVERRLQPFFWDPVDQTAIAQAEIVDQELASHWNEIWFGVDESDERIIIGTTRPELLPACVAIFYHPDDVRYQHLKGRHAITPLFGVKVPIMEDDTVEPDKGTGIMMCCTFGDEADIEKWRKHDLDMQVVLNKYGKLDLQAFTSPNGRGQNSAAILGEGIIEALQNKKVSNTDPNHPGARETIIELLRESGDLKESKPITHTVKCAERSGAPLEILPTPQWFVQVMDKKDALKAKAAECGWHPDWMKLRMDQWIDGLNADWCISRQRYFGVPFPVWYVQSSVASDQSSAPEIVLAAPEQLPVNPLADVPLGYEKLETLDGVSFRARHIASGEEVVMTPDADVMDTWATSSISPQINAGTLHPLPNLPAEDSTSPLGRGDERLSLRERPKPAMPVSGEGYIPRDILEYARDLRQNQTDAESLVWSLLRRQSLGVKFRRQHPIGRYIADFCCVEHKLIVELDGSQHADDRTQRYDDKRTAELEAEGYRVLRFWNNEVLQHTDDVLEAIWHALYPLPNLPAEDSTSPGGRGDERLSLRERPKPAMPVSGEGESRHAKLYPADLRPQAHEIIRTWAFYTLVKSHLHHDTIPWHNLMISGWCLAEDKTKMSKSKGNVVTPIELIAEHGTDAVRYWAATSRLGQDTAFSRDLLKIGKKLVTKLFNATKFAAIHLEKLESSHLPSPRIRREEAGGAAAGGGETMPAAKEAVASGLIFEAFDRWMIGRLQQAVSQAGDAFARYEYADALRTTDHLFWKDFCDNYLELIKKRIYAPELEVHQQPAVPAASAVEAMAMMAEEQEEVRHIARQQQSAVQTVYACLQTILRLYAPFIPHITEELFSHIFPADYAAAGSLHARNMWPEAQGYAYDAAIDEAGMAALEVLEAIRKAKSERSLSIKYPIARLDVAITDNTLTRDALEPFMDDVKAAGNVEALHWQERAPADAAASEGGRFALAFTFAEATERA